jgi:RimJ/RimL family protein N-acetyltransferase
MNDLDALHHLLDIDLHDAEFGTEAPKTLPERKRWLQWSILNYEELAKLNQPPYGDRAAMLKQTGQLIGACGFVPSFAPFEQIPAFRSTNNVNNRGLNTPEFGLYYAFSPAFQRRGYATEAAKALIDYAFTQLRLKRVVATTTYENDASIGVMRKVGMQIEKNPYADPFWFQVVGFIENKSYSPS